MVFFPSSWIACSWPTHKSKTPDLHKVVSMIPLFQVCQTDPDDQQYKM